MEEVLPDPTDLAGGLAYIDQEARAGHFKDRSDLDVFRYLWVNCWHQSSFQGKQVILGQVLEGRVRVDDIASATMLGDRAVKYALARLAVGGWIAREQIRFESKSGPGWKYRNEIFVLMDTTSHRARSASRGATIAPQEGQ